MTKPFTPAEARAAQIKRIPPEVVAVFNEALAEGIGDGKSVVLRVADMATRVADKTGISRDALFANKYLDIEPLFREQGWKVKWEGNDFGDGGYWLFEVKP